MSERDDPQRRLAASRARIQHWLGARPAAPAAAGAPWPAMLGELGPQAVRELAQQHPLALAGAAAAAGALLVAARPWPALGEWGARCLAEMPPSLLAEMLAPRHASAPDDATTTPENLP